MSGGGEGCSRSGDSHLTVEVERVVLGVGTPISMDVGIDADLQSSLVGVVRLSPSILFEDDVPISSQKQ